MASTKILTIDDSKTVRVQLQNILETAGFTVVQAQDGPEGLEQLRLHRDFNLIICDVNMPGMTGLQMLEMAIKDDLIGANVPVFMLTTEVVTQRMAEAKRARVTAWIIKPPNPKSLLSTISKVLDLEKATPAPRGAG